MKFKNSIELQKYFKEKKITLREGAKIYGISRSTLHDVLRGIRRWELHAHFFEKVKDKEMLKYQSKTKGQLIEIIIKMKKKYEK